MALPFAAIALAYDAVSRHDWTGTANAALSARVDSIVWGTPGVSVVSELYPPIASIVAIIVPGGALGLGLAGSFVAGLTLQLVLQSMKRKHFAAPIRAVFAVTLAATPAFAYLVTTNLEAALGLMFFGLGMLDLVRFVTYANTQAGFRAGILFACSAFSDSTGLFTALIAAATGALIIQSRPGARLANAVVVVFPTLALLGALSLLGMAFGGGPLGMIRGTLEWDPQRAQEYAQAVLMMPEGLLYFAPTLLMLATAIVLRHTGVGLVAALLTGMTGLAFIVGLTPPGTAGNNFVMMMLLAVAVVPTATTRGHAALVIATSLLLWVAGWTSSLHLQAIHTWLGVFAGGIS
ncbi:MAG: hypothetical protein QM611_06370 [Microbacterium sp.]|uniref:hypothetical protein n=1 Tax=Microbacterium sp. TaxID=51671 RepID=UPI0039E6DC54